MGYGFQAVVTVIVALATLEATTLLQYFSSRKAMQEEATRRAEDQLESTNLLICDVLDQVETAVHNNVWPVRKTLAAPDSLWSLVRRIVECNPSVSGSTIALAENYFPQKGRLFSPYAFRDGNRINLVQVWDHNPDGSITFNLLYTFEKDNRIFQKEEFQEHYHPFSLDPVLDKLKALGYTDFEIRPVPSGFPAKDFSEMEWYRLIGRKPE